MSSSRVVPLVLCLGLLTTGCQTLIGGSSQTVGTVGGAVAGGFAGNQIGKGEGRVVATTLGVVAGGLVGNRIGSRLDELDRRRAQEAEFRALEYGRSGSPVAWQNPDSGRYGEIVPAEPYQNAGRNCRDYTHTVYIDGQPEVLRGAACRQPDGQWAAV